MVQPAPHKALLNVTCSLSAAIARGVLGAPAACGCGLRRSTGSGISLELAQRKRDRLVHRQRTALLPLLGERSFVELGADRRQRLLVHPRDPGLAAADLL